MSSKDEHSDSGEDFDMDGIQDAPSAETLKTITALQKSLEDNSNQYELHIQLIVLLKGTDMFEQLRSAREKMSATFPLTEELWLSWIQDESNMAASEEEKKHVLKLYERATSDYLSINIWKSYLDYAIRERMELIEFPENEPIITEPYLINLFKKAIKFTGQHVAQSHIVWNTWMELELQQLALKDSPEPKDIEKLKAMYLERINVPHLDLDNTFSSMSSFMTKYNETEYEETMVKCNQIVNTTRKALDKIAPYEELLVSTGNDTATFASYLDYEIRHNRNQFARIRTLYERVVAVHCLVPVFWNDYLNFLMTSELYLKPEEDIKVILASALSDFNLVANPQEVTKPLQAYCAYRLRLAGKNNAKYKDVSDAFEHARKLEEIPTASLSDNGLTSHLPSWRFGDYGSARKVFARACQHADNMDWPEKVIEAWLLFERSVGTAQSYKDALMRSRNAMKRIETLRAQNAQSDIYGPQAVQEDVLTGTTSATTVIVQDDSGVDKKASKKRKFSAQDDGNDLSTKVSKMDDGPSQETKEQKPGPKKPLDIGAGRHSDTCFVTNFPISMTEQKLKELFQQYGKILRCNIPVGKNGIKRQFAYIQFEFPSYTRFIDQEQATAALALHGRDVGDRRGLSVKISDTSQKKERGAGRPPLPFVSRHEVHIAGVSNELKEEDLRKLVALYAEPTSVFIMRTSEAKGGPWANVKFNNENDADAVLALDGTIFQGKNLSVTRRLFTKKTSEQEDEATETHGPESVQLSRRDRRAKQRAVKDDANDNSEGNAKTFNHASAQQEADTMDTGKNEEKDIKSADKKEGGEGTTRTSSSGPAETSCPAVKAVITAPPRSMQPRILSARGKSLKQPASHARPPTRAFKPAVTSAATSTSTVSSSSIAIEEGGTTAPSAPKSNAEFRALMLSGTLRKRDA
ncbi:Squamous cell carcinoma antigen recognized by T-cells 3 [Mortierella claussenii]|nr:Squamous cell carcinoma antigen recognized by T-cells 3 [Mortierella claussenii]